MTKKAAEMKHMLESSAVNFGLLQPTVTPQGTPAAVPPPPAVPPVEAKQEVAKREKVQGSPAKKAAPAAKSQSKPAKAGNTGGAGKSEKDEEKADSDPFGYSAAPAWPLVGYEKPFLIPVPEAQARGGAALTVRIPLDLNLTLDAHLGRLGVKNLSEWIRHAVERQLSVEQNHLAKK